MLKIISHLVRQFIFWILFFAMIRAVFLIYHIQELSDDDIAFREVLLSFYHAFNLDMATTCYILILPFFILSLQALSGPVILNRILLVFAFIVIALYSVLTTAEIGIYREWKTKITIKALNYLQRPDEIYNSARTGTFFLLLSILGIEITIGFIAFNRFFLVRIPRITKGFLGSALFILLTPGLLFLGIRGGWQPIPISQSQAYFSRHQILNLSATNSFFNLGHSIYENQNYLNKNPFVFYEAKDAQNTLHDIYNPHCDSTQYILKKRRPNIVLFILESWSADLIESLGAMPGVTPFFHDLEQEGVLFTRIYSSGSRSEQGMASIFNGAPAHPVTCITYHPDKFIFLPSMISVFKESGYYSSFYFGGQLIYGNIKGLMLNNGFERITEQKDFQGELRTGKLGIHDGEVFHYQAAEADEFPQPFFSAIFSLSTHSPYDMPMQIRNFIPDNQDYNLYLNSAWYTDSCLRAYFSEVHQKDWYDSTLFILMADHGHHSYKQWDYHSPEYHRIFMLFAGPVIRDEWRGIKQDHMGSQFDLPATLLKQLRMNPEEFRWSRNLLDPCSPRFAPVAFEEGIGWIRPEGYYFYDKRLDLFYCKDISPGHEERLIREGKSFLQLVYQEYLEY
ncbi:MAG: sulfatase-like hydrolase/transferase [Bacteroidales bacterium]|nr:sulfatase-like hydrolase/transferase [Bacteroidales bacterium]